MLPMTVLRRFDCVLASSTARVLAGHARRKSGKIAGPALNMRLNRAAGQRFYNRSPLDFEKLKGDPDNFERHLVSYIAGLSQNVREIFASETRKLDDVRAVTERTLALLSEFHTPCR